MKSPQHHHNILATLIVVLMCGTGLLMWKLLVTPVAHCNCSQIRSTKVMLMPGDRVINEDGEYGTVIKIVSNYSVEVKLDFDLQQYKSRHYGPELLRLVEGCKSTIHEEK